MLIPNPFYAAYAAGALAADCEPVYLPATRATGFLPDLDALDDALLARTVAFYLASPSNPQGAVADRAYLDTARRRSRAASASWCSPTNAIARSTASTRRAGMLEAAGPDFANVVVFHSLSKRSNLPGLRVGFAAGDRRFLARLSRTAQRRRAAGAGAGAARRHRRLWRRGACRGEPQALSRQVRSRRPDHRRPLRLRAPGRRILSLARRVAHGGSEAVTKRLWQEAGVRVVPGRYLAREQADGSNPGADYIRVAMVQDKDDHGRGAASPRRGARLR